MLPQYPGLVNPKRCKGLSTTNVSSLSGVFCERDGPVGQGIRSWVRLTLVRPRGSAVVVGPCSSQLAGLENLGIDVALLVLLIAKVGLVGPPCPDASSESPSEGESIPVEAPPFRFLPCPQRKLGTWSARAHSSGRKLNHRSLQASPSTRSGPPMFPQVISRAQHTGRQLAGRQAMPLIAPDDN